MYFVKYCYFAKVLNGNHTWNENVNVRMLNALRTKPVKLSEVYIKQRICKVNSIEHILCRKGSAFLVFHTLITINVPGKGFGCPSHGI